MVRKLKEKEFMIDYHLNNVIVFPPKAPISDLPCIQVSSSNRVEKT